MENLVWIIYFVDVLSVDEGFVFYAGMTAIVYCAAKAGLILVPENDPDRGTVDKLPAKTIGRVALALILYAWLIPSKDTAYKMLAAYGVTEIATNDKVKELGGKSLQVLEKAMDEYIKEKK